LLVIIGNTLELLLFSSCFNTKNIFDEVYIKCSCLQFLSDEE